MDNATTQPVLFDWRWMIVTYCFLVLFHLTPSSLILGTELGAWNVFLRASEHVLTMATWLVLGIFIVNAYIGYRSRGVTIFGSGVASSLYLLTVVLATSIPGAYPSTTHRIIIVTLWLMLVVLGTFLLGCAGTAFGRWLRTRKSQIGT